MSYGISITTLEEVFLHINKELGVGFEMKHPNNEVKLEKNDLNELIVTEKDPFVANSNSLIKGRVNVNNSYPNTNNSSTLLS